MIANETQRPIEFGWLDYSNRTDNDWWNYYLLTSTDSDIQQINIQKQESTTPSGWPTQFSEQKILKDKLSTITRLFVEVVSKISGAEDIVLLDSDRHLKRLLPNYYWKLQSPFQTTTSTAKETKTSSLISPPLRQIFINAKEEHFEDGMESQFSYDLIQLIKIYKEPAIELLGEWIPNGIVNIEIGAEALRWVGRMHDQDTYESRRRLLEYSLFSRFPRIRDAAGLGLASMNDLNSVNSIRKAIDQEEIGELKNDLTQVLVDLESQ